VNGDPQCEIIVLGLYESSGTNPCEYTADAVSLLATPFITSGKKGCEAEWI